MSRWTRQPQGPVKIDRNNPLTVGLADAILPFTGVSVVNQTRGNMWYSLPVKKVTSTGLAVAYNGSDGRDSQYYDAPWVRPTGGLTLLAFEDCTGSFASFTGAVGISSSTFAIGFTIVNSGGFKFAVATKGTADETRIGTAAVAGAHVRVLTTDGAGFTTGYLNGKIDGTGGATTGYVSMTSNATLHVGAYDPYFTLGGGVGRADYRTVLVVLWHRVLTDAEIRAVSANPWQIFTKREMVYPSVATVQLLRPTSDITPGAWTASTGIDLFAMLDETTASDADYITTSSASSSEVAFGTGLDPLSSTGHTIRFRAQGTGGLTVTLLQGATTIATYSPTITASFATYSYTLSGAEADAISDYTALRLRFTST